jgi:2-oxoisovalerate dehydrogenase E2 component (dihydrolipoyl transacylase)
MPRLGESVTEGTVIRWLKEVGDTVKEDEPLVEVSTDKVNSEIASPYDGVLIRIDIKEGDTAAVGEPIALIEVANESGATISDGEGAPRAIHNLPGGHEDARLMGDVARSGRQESPAVRRLAQEHGLNLSDVPGTGDKGRVTREDALAYIKARDADASKSSPTSRADRRAEELVTISPTRRRIAARMLESLTTAPHAWTMMPADVSNLVSFRESSKDDFRRQHGTRLTYTALLVRLLTDALKAHPHINATWTGAGILVKKYYDIGIATAAPSGLVVPVVRDADGLGLVELSHVIADLTDRARRQALTLHDVEGGTFTLSNSGALGTTAGMAIINQGQAAILSTGAILRSPAVVDERIEIRHMMNLCISIDHRVIDGEDAARFLATMRESLETWTPARAET